MKPMFPLGVMLYVFTVTTITVTLGQCSAEGNWYYYACGKQLWH